MLYGELIKGQPENYKRPRVEGDPEGSLHEVGWWAQLGRWAGT